MVQPVQPSTETADVLQLPGIVVDPRDDGRADHQARTFFQLIGPQQVVQNHLIFDSAILLKMCIRDRIKAMRKSIQYLHDVLDVGVRGR